MSDVEGRPEARLHDPLSPVTREERKTLLGLSAVGLIIAKSGLIPSKISTLGIEFDHTDQGALLRMFAAVILYFLVAFVVYAMSDLSALRLAIFRIQREADLEAKEYARGPASQPSYWVYGPFRIATVVRAAFEFGVPLLVGAVAVGALLMAPTPKMDQDGSAKASTPVASLTPTESKDQ